MHFFRFIALPILVLTCQIALAEDLRGNTARGLRNDGGDEILLQGFHWNSSRSTPQSWYSMLKDKAPQIRADGFTSVWMPVPWRDTSHWSDANTQASGGGEGYFWQDFDKNSAYGNADTFKQAVDALSAAGVKLVYDVVPNHMDRQHIGPQLKERLSDKEDWRDGCTQCDDGDPFMGGEADLNTAKPEVFALFGEEFARLRDSHSADGLRFDFVKGYSAATVNRWMEAFGDQQFCVGELWKAPGEYPPEDSRHIASWQDALKQWSDQSRCTVFDFALKERMQNGDITQWKYGLNANPDANWRAAAVTFVDNHDTGYSPGANGGQHHWALPEHLRDQAYAYILSSPGTPTVYWPDMYDWPRGSLLRQLIQIRRSAGIRADSPISFLKTATGLVAEVTGTRQLLLIALGSDYRNEQVPASFKPALSSGANEAIRIWRANAVEVQLTCTNGQTRWGEGVYAIGSGLELGEWDPARAVRLDETGEYPDWRQRIRVADNAAYEWKCIVRSDAEPEKVIKWQEGANTRFVAKEGGDSKGGL
ncbi:glucan 1,4-alpha-maltohexaosidase [Pseudomonas floridensis]|uniref:Glucan 1,4-alpha-maltohexaosidase n=1 Tax=Pseudomonas floridensis TaxID=1958950 RepID=A0A1X0N5X3_9PSED|nr:glucan 1,4-alpha-maltotetraohydrolase domain-containing protein [Pseudomonas floridensis]ORC59008.1 glucan 1,4-alpha-maltohexaosidase [Pseudomonas floridensis]